MRSGVPASGRDRSHWANPPHTPPDDQHTATHRRAPAGSRVRLAAGTVLVGDFSLPEGVALEADGVTLTGRLELLGNTLLCGAGTTQMCAHPAQPIAATAHLWSAGDTIGSIRGLRLRHWDLEVTDADLPTELVSCGSWREERTKDGPVVGQPTPHALSRTRTYTPSPSYSRLPALTRAHTHPLTHAPLV